MKQNGTIPFRVLLSALLLALLFSLFACAGGKNTPAATEPDDGKPAAFCSRRRSPIFF